MVHFDCTKNPKTDNWVLVAFFFVFELLLWSSICSATKDIAEVAASDVRNCLVMIRIEWNDGRRFTTLWWPTKMSTTLTEATVWFVLYFGHCLTTFLEPKLFQVGVQHFDLKPLLLLNVIINVLSIECALLNFNFLNTVLFLLETEGSYCLLLSLPIQLLTVLSVQSLCA